MAEHSDRNIEGGREIFVKCPHGTVYLSGETHFFHADAIGELKKKRV
jgi:hypothetical protein